MVVDPPTPPTDLPAYVTDPIARQDPATLEAIRAYVDDLLAHHEAVEDQALESDELAADSEALLDVEETEGGTVVIKTVPCGKECEGCPHGPYKYVVRREGDSLEWDYRGAIDV